MHKNQKADICISIYTNIYKQLLNFNLYLILKNYDHEWALSYIK